MRDMQLHLSLRNQWQLIVVGEGNTIFFSGVATYRMKFKFFGVFFPNSTSSHIIEKETNYLWLVNKSLEPVIGQWKEKANLKVSQNALAKDAQLNNIITSCMLRLDKYATSLVGEYPIVILFADKMIWSQSLG